LERPIGWDYRDYGNFSAAFGCAMCLPFGLDGFFLPIRILKSEVWRFEIRLMLQYVG